MAGCLFGFVDLLVYTAPRLILPSRDKQYVVGYEKAAASLSQDLTLKRK